MICSLSSTLCNKKDIMRLLSVLIVFVLCSSLSAQDTFSIVAVDPETGEVGSAGASCVPNIGSIGGVILLSGIIPGRGGVNAQAYICIDPHVNLDNAIQKMEEGLSPNEILFWLQQNDACFSQGFDPSYRQYGIAAFDENGAPEAAAFTGDNTDDWKGHRVGDNYSIQGNILMGPEIVDSMEARFLATEGSLAERLMAAMQGANVPGADARCLSAGTSSTSAFLRVFGPDDDPEQPSLELNVAETPTGVEPIDSLQVLFDAWLVTNDEEPVGGLAVEFTISPNPANGLFRLGIHPFRADSNYQLELFALDGKEVLRQPITSSREDIRLADKGVFLLRVSDAAGQPVFSEKLINY
jgi:uncharacterized Ntn-hydrolase superfamily protein